MPVKAKTFKSSSQSFEVGHNVKKSPEALPQVEIAENRDSEIMQLKQRMMEELKLKGLDMDAIERILHIRDLV